MVRRWTTAIFISLVIFLPSLSARARSFQDQKDEVKEDFDLMTPVRRGEHFDEIYYRIETRLGETQKREFAKLNKELGSRMGFLPAPEMKKGADFLLLRQNDEELLIQLVVNAQGEFALRVNGHLLTSGQALSPLAAEKALRGWVREVPSGSAKTAWLWDLFFPSAHAEVSTGLVIAGVAAVAVVGYLIYKKSKSSSASACSKEASSCCDVSGQPVQISNGCCTEVGGFKVATPICPVSFYNQAPVVTPVQSGSTGVR